MNLNLTSNKNQIENADHEMQNADIVQSAQNAQNQHNEIEASRVEKEKSSNIEVHIEKTIDEKMEKIQSLLDKKLNQMINLIQPRTSTSNVQIAQNSNAIPLIPRQYKDQNASKNVSSSTSWAQVVSRNTTKSAKINEKKDFAKSAKSDAWLSRRMIGRPKNQISTINAVKYRNKINDALRLHKKGNVLVQTV